MKRFIFLCVCMLSLLLCTAQTYKYIGVEDGLSNRRVYAIQKGFKGYMWFLTHDGIDRYNGKDFKQYKLMDGEYEVGSMMNLNWLYLDSKGKLWEIGKKGRIFCYDNKNDSFKLIYKLPENETDSRHIPVTYAYMDHHDVIWLCNDRALYLYDTATGKPLVIRNNIRENVTNIVQIDSTHYFIGTEVGIHYADLQQGILSLSPCNKLDTLKFQTNELYYHKKSRKVFIGTFQKGLFVYDLNLHRIVTLKSDLTDISINRIRAFGENEILIATDGAGVYKMNVHTYENEPYIVADFNSYNGMNGNTINDIYIDEEKRIWMANYPIGVTVRDNRYSDYNWIRHSLANEQSLINDQVNAIIEDSENDLWFATNNGVSLYNRKTGKWNSFLSVFNEDNHNQNHTFLSLCEVAPGIIWVGGYGSGLYQIDKKSLSVSYFTPSLFSNQDIHPDKYVRAITKDSQGNVWSGGYYNLKKIDYDRKTMKYIPGLEGVTVIIEKNDQSMWVGTTNGLYLLDKTTGKYRYITLPVETSYIYSLYQSPDGLLYIGTNNSGLLIYHPRTKEFKHFHKNNSAIISNNIYSILSDGEQSIVLSTENGLSQYNIGEKSFHNWTKEQGLQSNHFNAASGVFCKNGTYVLGSMDGAIEFSKDMELPRDYKFKMVFSDFRVFYQTVYPNDKDSPLSADIDETRSLRLKYSQNIFSLQVSSINYDCPSLILYSWKLEGFYDGWSRPSEERIIRFTNLNPGKYTLRVRALSSEDRRIILEERTMDIIVEKPAWLSTWALIGYALAFVGIAGIILRIIVMRKQRKISNEKIQFFINTAHDIRTPLTLIKAPLEEVAENETLSENGHNNIQTSLRNVNALLRITTNLINFERAGNDKSALNVSEYELNAYMEEVVNAFRSFAQVKRVNLIYESNFHYLNVWIDKDKMDSILKNILSNALKYTPEGGSVHVFAGEDGEDWCIEVRDTGIGVPASEQKKLFKMYFRGSNAINSKITGSGIGLLLVSKLIGIHKGKFSFSSTEGKGSSMKITFPKAEKHYRKALKPSEGKSEAVAYPYTGIPPTLPPEAENNVYESTRQETCDAENRQKLLIVEDNDELRQYLRTSLSRDYDVQVCSNAKEALIIIPEYFPHLVISDIMMPEMRGDDLCKVIKSNIETSHIPVILLTALNTDKDIIEGLQVGADEYIVKPFNIGILRATIANLLTNRALLRKKYANLELDEDEDNGQGTRCINCSTDLDWKFIASVKQGVEDNMDNTELTVDTLAALLNMSRSSFYLKLKALTDHTPSDYIRLIRLKRAAQLLKEKQHTISEISGMTGFSDPKYFREVFKKHYNMSPSRYAKEDGNDDEDDDEEE